MDRQYLEGGFEEQMLNIYVGAKEIHYYATRFFQMLTDRGGLATARHLLAAPGISEGFEALWERGRLDLTVEALVLREPWDALFTPEELEVARSRLQSAGYQQIRT